MSVITLSDGEALYDMLLCFCAGAVLASVYGCLTELFPFKGSFMMLLWHIAFFSASGVVCFCFVIGVTACREPRWQLVAGFAAGASVYALCLAGIVRGAAKLVVKLIRLILSPVTIALKKLAGLARKTAERLKTASLKRYNRRKEKKHKRAEEDDGQQEKKTPLKAAKET